MHHLAISRARLAAPRARRLGVLFAALAALAASGCKEQPKPQPRLTAQQLAAFGVDPADAPAPPIELVALDGSKFTLGSAKGQVVFVNFWATWCPPCRDEMPSMLALGRELEERHPGKFKMVAVSVDEGWDPVREFFAAPPYMGSVKGLTVALDPDQKTTVAYYCAARGGCPDSFKFPESYIIDKSGRLVAYVVGPRNWSAPAARAFLEALIGS
jgi:thiol-disulfide isomerase/thioredoxin